MLALAGYPLGLHFRFLDPSPEAPVGRIAQRVTADYTDRAALEKFSSGLELVTYEFENVPVEAANFLGRARSRLSSACRSRSRAGPPRREGSLPHTRHRHHRIRLRFESRRLDAAVKTLGLPAVLKTSRMGYDGKRPVDTSHCRGRRQSQVRATFP